MGKKDDAIVPFFKDKHRFSDLFNGALFHGKQLISPDELEFTESVQTAILKDKHNKKHYVKRYRDIVMNWKNKLSFVILACEVQENVHYAMPVRNMIYDGLTYMQQIEDLWKNITEIEKQNITREEFLSHFRKEDFISPVITIVLYYGDDWNGNLDLHSMFDIDNRTWAGAADNELLKKYIPNYHINLINPTKISDLSVFKSDLQLIFGMLKYKDDKEKLFNFTKDNKSYFSSVNGTTINAIDAFLNFNVKLETILEKDEKEEKDMCKALDDLYNEGVQSGMQQGTITAFRNIGWKDDAIIEKLIEIHKMTADEAKEIISATI